ncbi:gag-pol fusion protein [Gigaspora margarita]|uniref:Gag-pol fusion protein n=1 Tax=Gigaspora margarita TaxID=4874 RepID=A0A8H4A756_GIGMA|nr:gag-pol fusion protein [Gigaspora margarita]
MNNLILAIGNDAPNQLWESKVVNFPTFSGGDQDLLIWLDEFDEACIANHISKARRFDILLSHLKGPAYMWQRSIAYTFIDELRQELREPVEIECSTTIQQALKKAKAAKAAYSRGAPLSSYSLKRSYLSQESSTNEEIGELKKAISEMVQSVKTLIQRQKNKKPITSPALNSLQYVKPQSCHSSPVSSVFNAVDEVI